MEEGLLYILKKTISDAFEKPIETIDINSDLVKDLNLGEIDLVELGVEIEKVFAVVVNNIDYSKYKTVGSILDLIIEKLEIK